MVIGKIKKHTLRTITKKKTVKEDFEQEVLTLTGGQYTKEKVLELVEKGRVYGFYNREKKLVTLYLFERIDDYFVKNGDSMVRIGEKEFSIADKWFGESNAAYRFVDMFYIDSVEEILPDFEKVIIDDLKDQIEFFGNVAGVEWNDNIFYRRIIDCNNKNYWWGYLLGAVVGFIFGNCLFDGFFMGLIWAVAFAPSFGLCFSKTESGEKEEDSWGKIELSHLSDAFENIFEEGEEDASIAVVSKNAEDKDLSFVNENYRGNAKKDNE